MLEALLKVMQWFVPPMDHDPVVQYAFRVRMAFFGCVSFATVAYLCVALVLEMGPPLIRPASAQSVATQVRSIKQDVAASLGAVQGHLDVIERQQHDDRVERLEQQLLWYRQQNCKSKGAARNYTWQKLMELRDRFRAVANTDWPMPACSDIGE